MTQNIQTHGRQRRERMDALQQYQNSLLRQTNSLHEDWDLAHRLLDVSPTKMVCRATIEWRDFGGGKTTLTSGYHFHIREARKQVLRDAIRSGWTYPRWWQWWRWDDSRPDLDFTSPTTAAPAPTASLA